MRRATTAAFLAALVATLAAFATGVAGAGTPGNGAPDEGRVAGPHDLVGPLGLKQRELREEALKLQLQGKISRTARTARVGQGRHSARGQFVELDRQGEDSIWTVIADFGNTIHPVTGGTPGPVHNQIPQPDRTVDNTTIWAPDYTEGYYEQLLFSEAPGASSMRNFYIEQSSGRYTVNGDVTDWVQVPYNEARYGTNICGDIVCSTVWTYVRDAVNAWYDQQVAAGKTQAEIEAYLSQFDQWDRYDYDGDGNFDEPDGYIDHFQTIHAGVGEETGGGAQGEDAIWSHRWYAYPNNIGVTGPSYNKLGGAQVGSTGLWVGDYTVEPENGGVGVFSHEFAHDLGLPDEYDTSGNTGGAENSTGFWTLMSSGSYGNDGKPEDGIGNEPFHMNAWDKLYLGWLNYAEVSPGDRHQRVLLGPAEFNSTAKQGLVVNLPDKQRLETIYPARAGSTYAFYSGKGNNLDQQMTKAFTLPASGPISLDAKLWYSTEAGYDYVYVDVSTDTGTSWTNLSTLDGDSGGWIDYTADLSAYAGQNVTIRFRYLTDAGVSLPGVAVDDISVAGGAPDTAETGTDGWTLTGFTRSQAQEQRSYANAYIAENRTYWGFDAGLKTGPYNFGGTVGPNWAERFPYQNGVVVWYWDTSYDDNNVGDHPGSGLILPVDSHPKPLHWSDGSLMRPRIQAYDTVFTWEPTKAITLHKAGVETKVKRQLPQPLFDDTKTWWYASDPGDALGRYQAGWNGVDVPKTGTKLLVEPWNRDGYVQVNVWPAR